MSRCDKTAHWYDQGFILPEGSDKREGDGSMKKFGWLLLGAISLLAIEGLAAAIVLARAHGWSAREEPSRHRTVDARRARHAAIPADAKAHANPVPKTPEAWPKLVRTGPTTAPPVMGMTAAAIRPLESACIPRARHEGGCHTEPERWRTVLHRAEWNPSHRNARMGQFRSGCGGFWKLVYFIRHLPDLTLEERRQMEKLNPKTPEQLQEEAEEERFLRGEGADAPEQPHHHH